MEKNETDYRVDREVNASWFPFEVLKIKGELIKEITSCIL